MKTDKYYVELPPFTGRNVPISEIAKATGKDAQYIRTTGKSRFTQRFADDLKDFYEEMGLSDIATFYPIQNALRGEIFDFSVICQIAFFLGISVEELTNPKLTKEQLEAEQLLHRKENNFIDWGKYDDELSMVLERFANGVYAGEANENPLLCKYTDKETEAEIKKIFKKKKTKKHS